MARGRQQEEFKAGLREGSQRLWRSNGTHFIIEGKAFATAREVFQYAVRNLGYNGTQQAMANRLHFGQASWEQLLQYNPKYRSTRLQTTAAENAEMQALIAGIDARKREIAARQAASEPVEE
jgi:hypothetical protein